MQKVNTMPTEQPVKEIFDTKDAINDRTDRAMLRVRSYLRTAAVLSDDAQESRRLTDQECRYCYYLRRARAVGWAFTDYTCGICEAKQSWPNTGVPRLCKRCAKEHNLCVMCGADLELKKR